MAAANIVCQDNMQALMVENTGPRGRIVALEAQMVENNRLRGRIVVLEAQLREARRSVAQPTPTSQP
jgi:hypothetical protein